MVELRTRVRLAGLVAGPLAGLVLYAILPESYVDEKGQLVALADAARAAAGVGLWMAIW